jgi:type IV secretory pathway VirB4 component
MAPTDFPILSDLYDVIEDAYQHYDQEQDPLYPKELLREILLGIHSLCRGAESKFFNGHTNVTSDRFLVFGVKGLLQANNSVKNAMLFNVLSFLSDKLLTEGNTVATLDELYIWLSNPTTIEYIRNVLKRVRKKESSLIMASQNLEDFDVDGIRELTRPLFAIPTHQFLFNAGTVNQKFYMENLQLGPSQFDLIRYPHQGVCLYKCGNEVNHLEVIVPSYKGALFGKMGGR